MPPPGTQPRNPAAPSAAGKETNEYIPSFISKKPFYIGDDDSQNDYLEHQRLQKAQAEQSKWYDRGKKAGPAATKFRKGACENCGAMTHKTKECLSRPRAKGAKWTGKNIQADEVIQDVKMGWDAKRDRWNGYDPSEYKHVVEEFAEVEKLKKEMGKQEQDDADAEDLDDAKYAEESEMGRKQATSSKQLRIREDTAKYLLNLDLDSAKYDPKSRSMLDAGATHDNAAALVAEEGFLRASGDAAEFEKAQKYAWESQEKSGSTKLHLQANPTSGEYFRRKEKEEAEAKRAAHKKMLLEKYGGEDNSAGKALRDAAVVESERYVEYDESGAIKGAPKVIIKSKYPEDVFINNHTCVWGSWWSNFQWGYACCHSLVKNSYCTGEAGKKGFEEAERMRTGGLDEPEEEPRKEIEWPVNGDNDMVTAIQTFAIKKRTAEEISGGVTEEELDEWKRKRTAANDPMGALLGKDELLAEQTDPTYPPVVVVDFVPQQPQIEDPRYPGLIYGFPDDGFPDKNGALEVLKVASILEAAGIQCCMTGTSALIFFGAGRIRGDWQVCVPTEKLDLALALLQSAPHTDHYTLSQVLPFIGVGSLLHTFPRFKCRGLRLWFQIIPSEDCHIECKSSNFEYSNLGLPYPRLEVYAQSLLDSCNRVDICDLVDGMNLSREWGEEHLDLTGTNDVDWMEKKNERILKSVPDNENSCLFLLYGEESRRKLWEKTTSLKEHRLGWKYPKEHYATRFRLHIDPDPRYTPNRCA